MKTDSLNRVYIKRIVIAMAVTACLILTSCTQEKLDGDAVTPIGKNVELRFKAFATNEVVEESVNRVRVVIFGSYQSADRGKLIYNQVATPRADGSIDRILISAGLRDIYLIINEPLDAKEQYDAIKTSDELRNMKVFYKGGITADAALKDGLPMFSSYINQMVSGENNVFGTGVEYLLAKVSLNIEFTAGGITEIPNVGDVLVTGMKIYNIPQYGTFAPFTYNSRDYHTAEVVFTTTESDNTTTYSSEIYLPEHIVKSADSKTFVEIKGKNKETGENSTWIVKLGDATVTNPPAAKGTPYNITRNMHYTVKGTIKSYGEVDVNLKVEIAPWGTINTGSNAGEFIVCDTKEVTLTRNSDNSSTIAPVTFSANNMAGAVITSKNGRVLVDKSQIANGKLGIYLDTDINIGIIEDYDNYDEVSIIIDNYVHTIKVSYQSVIEMTKQEPAVGTQIPWSGGTGRVTCQTTVGEWYIVLKDDKGNVYAKSDKTPSVTKKTEQNMTLQIPVNINGAPINYVVEVHHETLLLENDFSPKHTFRNRQEAGYKLTLSRDATSSFTPTDIGGEGALLSSVDPTGKQHELYFKYGSLYGIKSWIINDVRTRTTDSYSTDDIAWIPKQVTIPSSWTSFSGSTGAFTHSVTSVNAAQGDPCRMVGLTTHDIATGKVDNGTWRMITLSQANAFFQPGHVTTNIYSILYNSGALFHLFGYRTATGQNAQQALISESDPNQHGLWHIYNNSAQHLCIWIDYHHPTLGDTWYLGGGVNAQGKSNAVGLPNPNNALSVRCIKVRP